MEVRLDFRHRTNQINGRKRSFKTTTHVPGKHEMNYQHRHHRWIQRGKSNSNLWKDILRIFSQFNSYFWTTCLKLQQWNFCAICKQGFNKTHMKISNNGPLIIYWAYCAHITAMLKVSCIMCFCNYRTQIALFLRHGYAWSIVAAASSSTIAIAIATRDLFFDHHRRRRCGRRSAVEYVHVSELLLPRALRA